MKRLTMFVTLISLLMGLIAQPALADSAQALTCNQSGSQTYWWGRQYYLPHGTVQWIVNESRPRDALTSLLGVPGAAIIMADWYLSNRLRDADRGCGVYINFNWAASTVPGLILFSRIGSQ